eukprot:13295562-Ditylum_brightwellii.AAC.1
MQNQITTLIASLQSAPAPSPPLGHTAANIATIVVAAVQSPKSANLSLPPCPATNPCQWLALIQDKIVACPFHQSLIDSATHAPNVTVAAQHPEADTSLATKLDKALPKEIYFLLSVEEKRSGVAALLAYQGMVTAPLSVAALNSQYASFLQ